MFESDAAAAEALAAAANQDASGHQAAAPEQAPVQPTHDNPPVDGTNQTSESFTHVDVNSLPPELQGIYRNLQGDYTRKTQEIAPIRKLMSETGMDAESAQKALEFVRGLDDPSNVRSLYDYLSEQFTEEEQAMGAAGEFDDPRDQQLQSLTQRIEKFEREVALNSARAELQRNEAAIREANPSLQDADMTRIRRLALSYEGNINQAAQEYLSWKNDVLGGYVQSKGSVQTGAVPPMAGGHAEQRTSFANLDEATKAAFERFRNEF